MDKGNVSGHASEAGMQTKWVEVVVATVLLILGVVVVYQSQKLGSGWTSDGPGAGYFPFLTGTLLVISSIGILYQALSIRQAQSEVFVTHAQLRLVLSVLVPAAVYVLGVGFLGIYLASMIYITLFMVILGKYPLLKSVVVALAVNALFFCMFEIWFKVPLYKGSLAPLSFLGY